MKKSRDQIVEDILKRLEEGTEIVSTEPGSIVRTFSEVLSEEFSQFYSEVDLVSTMSFVTTAKGQFLDLLGVMLNCYRNVGEDDETFRYRITNYVYVLAGANQISIRLKLLEIPEVRDVIMEEFTKGTGSFTVYIITDAMETSEDIIAAAQEVVEEHKGYGIKGEVKTPILISLKLVVRLILEESVSLAESTSIKESVRLALKNYADNIEIGGAFIITEAISVINDVSDSIIDMNVNEMYVNNQFQFVRNLSATKGERIFLEQVNIV